MTASHLNLESKLHKQFYHQKLLGLNTLCSYEGASPVGLNLPTAKMLRLKEKDVISLFKSVYPDQNSGNIKKNNSYFVIVLDMCGNVELLQLIFFLALFYLALLMVSCQ